MKKQFIKIFYSMLLLFPALTYGWNTDIIVTNLPVSGRSSAIAKNGNVLYAAVSPAVASSQYSVLIFQSSNGGITWTPASYTGSGPGSVNPMRIKLIKTIGDSLYCLYQVNGDVYILNLETGIAPIFNTVVVGEFDVAASTSFEAFYLYAQTAGTNNINRYGTNTGGYSWTGNTALVTGNGSTPRVHMDYGKLVLNYYGPVLPDLPKSVIRGAFYNETGNGTLTAGTFLDLATDTSVDKNIFQSAIYQSKIWFFYTESGGSENIQCSYSSNGGTSYNAAFPVASSANDEYTFDAITFTIAGGGCDLLYLSKPLSGGTDVFMTSTTAALPTTFSPASKVNDETFIPSGDFYIDAPTAIRLPLLGGKGAYWYGTDSMAAPVHYYDFTGTVGIQENNKAEILYISPNPSHDYINLSASFSPNEDLLVHIYDINGAKAAEYILSTKSGELQIPVNHLPLGNYQVRIEQNGKMYLGKIIVN